jgi:hypothetical protein
VWHKYITIRSEFTANGARIADILVKKSGKAVGKGFKKAGKETGHAFKQMGKDIGKAFKGEK